MDPDHVEDEQEEGPSHIVRLAWVDPPAILSLKGVLLQVD